MRKEYDFSKGERGKFYGKVDIENPIIEDDDEDSNTEPDSEIPKGNHYIVERNDHEQTLNGTNQNEAYANGPTND